MRIALLQLNQKLGDPAANGARIEQAYAKAVAGGAELVVTPELAVVGYLAEDRMWEAGLRTRVANESARLADLSGSVPLVFGTFAPAPSGRLFNELWWCQDGKVRQVIQKRTLPSYDVFEEHRWFEPSPEPPKLIEHSGYRIGVSICEDLWADREFSSAAVHYSCDPIAELVKSGATLLLNASASPTMLGSWLPSGKFAPWAVPSKELQRKKLIQGLAKKYGVPLVYADRVGADSWLLFDGGSCLVQPDGSWQGGQRFTEAIVWVDTDAAGSSWPPYPDESAWLRDGLRLGMRENLAKQGLEAVVIGLSGGIDSSVVAAIAAEVLDPAHVLGVALPTAYSSGESLSLAKDQAARLGIKFLCMDADAPFAGAAAAMKTAFPARAFSVTDENLQSRARAMLLMALTSEPAVHQLLGSSRVAVLNTGNKSEAATGYFTLYGDGIGAFSILGDCLKARVYGLAHALGEAITPGILTRVPTAELRPGQTDEGSLAPYAILDAILGTALEAQRPEEGLADDLALLLEGEGLESARAILPRILNLLRRTEFKRRQLPFNLKISPKAFGQGRRIPLTAL
ncbi:MAG: NAD(+) synthase [Holophagaceae bacterium]|nr:NAD(+) synthase [Holophagaceae bacterium]